MSEASGDRRITLSSVFGADLKKEIAVAFKGKKEDGRLRLTRRFLWWLVGPKVNANIDELMNLPINDALGGGFLKLEELRENGTKLLGAELDWIKLKKPYTFSWEREHEIEVEIDGRVRYTLQFDMKLGLTLTGPRLKVGRGRLYGAEPGDCTIGKSYIKCSVVRHRSPPVDPWVIPPIVPKKSWTIPGFVSFGPGIQVLPEPKEPLAAPAASALEDPAHDPSNPAGGQAGIGPVTYPLY